MAETETNGDKAITVPNWFVRICKWWWGIRGALLISSIVNIILGIIAGMALFDFTAFDKTPLKALLQHPYAALLIFVVVLAFTVISGLIARLGGKPSERAIRKQYLAQLEDGYELLSTTGVPASLMARRVRLEEIFIPLQFRPSPPLGTYPLSDKELEEYYELRRKGKQGMDRLLRSEQEWERRFRETKSIGMSDLWGCLTREESAIVIQGYPGMGKSTFLIRLALHMARRSQGKADKGMETLTPALIPIFVSLKEYAEQREKSGQDIPLLDFIKSNSSQKFPLAELPNCIEQWLNNCQCLVLLDGLDEITHEDQRQEIQEAIKQFIKNHKHPEERRPTYNRFLITSRVAGYDQKAFVNYPHFLVAELTKEQIDDFLPRWCRASARRDLQDSSEERIEREAKQMAQRLSKAVKNNVGVRQLAENPLLLTLLAAMQQSGVELPDRRAQLYRDVTKTLLNFRNEAKGIPPLPEEEAVQRLGPLAYKMHSEENGLAPEEEIITTFKEIIASPQGGGGSRTSVDEAARDYLKRLSERGGLLVPRTGDYYGFFHRTFEEYFAARHILNIIERDRERKTARNTNTQRGNTRRALGEEKDEILKFVEMVRHNYALWRETFLLAVAYKSEVDGGIVASNIIRKLIEASRNGNEEEQLRDLLLAATCIIEATEETIERGLQRIIADSLIQIYEQKLREQDYNACQQIENVTTRWLLALPKETHEPVLPFALHDAICVEKQPFRQKAALILLTLIDQDIQACPEAVYKILVPPLLALAGLPGVGRFELAKNIVQPDELGICDLVLTALSFMDKRGPAGAMLATTSQYFKDNPEQLHQLALYSLQADVLITPTVVPISEDHYEPYEAAFGKWLQLRKRWQGKPPTEQAIEDCKAIHNELLASAEEVAYPTSDLLLQVLTAAASNPDDWQAIWRNYLLTRLQNANYTTYQDTALFWEMLFPEQEQQKVLVSTIKENFNSSTPSIQRIAQRFVAFLVEDQRYQRDLRDLLNFVYPRDQRNLRNLRNLLNLRSLRNLSYQRELLDPRDLRNLLDPRDLRNLRALRGLRALRDLRDLRDLRLNLLTADVANTCITLLLSRQPIPIEQQSELLTILTGRLLHMQEPAEKGPACEEESKRIAEVALHYAANDAGIVDDALDILRSLPTRTANEIRYVRQLAEDATNARVQNACVYALRYAKPDGEDAWQVLEDGKLSGVAGVREAVVFVLKKKGK